MSNNSPIKFWDQAWSEFEPFELNPGTFFRKVNLSDKNYLAFIGDVRDKMILDIGCGNGIFSVYLAKRGGKVTAIDSSSIAIENTIKLAQFNGVETLVQTCKLDAFDLLSLNKKFDIIIGKFILHHLEPFEQFSGILREVMANNGIGVFLENNAGNPLLMFARRNFVGKFGIPKYGDAREHPFELKEKEILKKYFLDVITFYPEFLFFDLLCSYVFKDNRSIRHFLSKLDAWVYHRYPFVHKYSYRQIIKLVRD